MIDLTTLLVCGAYRPEDIALLFNLPKHEIETQFGPGYVRTADLLNRANQAGGYNSLDPNRPTSDTAAAFQAATAGYVLRGLLNGNASYSNAQLAALFAASGDAVESVLGAGPTSGANVYAAIASAPTIFPFANVTPATIALFQAG